MGACMSEKFEHPCRTANAFFRLELVRIYGINTCF